MFYKFVVIQIHWEKASSLIINYNPRMGMLTMPISHRSMQLILMDEVTSAHYIS